MRVVDFFASPDRAHWRAEILKSPWPAAAFLVGKVDGGAFFETFGEGARILLLAEGDRLVSFCTLAPRDEVDDPARTPWIGFAYTFEAWRGRRCLGRLLDHACALAAAEGFGQVWLSTDLVGVYEKYGFRYAGPGRSVWNGAVRVYARETGAAESNPIATEEMRP